MDSEEDKGRDGNSVTAFVESGSERNNGDGKSVGAVDGNAGFLDPTLARKTAGGDLSGAASPGPTETTSETVKRGRGRPRKDGSTGPTFSNVKEKISGPVSINGIEKILFSLHQIGAATLQIPELELTKDEAKKLGDAIGGVNEHFKLSLDPKTAAMIELVQIAGVIYVPRGVSLYIRKKMERQARPQPAQEPVRPNGSTVDFNNSNIAGMTFDPMHQKIVN